MTEKRFISIEKWFDEDGNRRVHVVLDNGEFWHNFMTQYGADKTCRKLNELNDENKKLKQKIESLKMEIAELRESEKDNYNITDGLW